MAVVLGWVILVVAPRWIYPPLGPQELQGLTGKDRVQAVNDRLKLQNDARAVLVQTTGGAVLLLGAYFTWRQVQNGTRALQHTQTQLGHAQAQLDLARAGQVTERFTRAIEQLGDDKLDIRLGGIYALERIPRDSSDDRGAIGEILTADVRRHTRLRRPGEEPAEDVQAILTVLSRGGFADAMRLDLRRANLQEMDLVGAHLVQANLASASLGWAILVRADLQQADLRGAILQYAILIGAGLQQVDLRDANLQGAHLVGAHLEGADLKGANLAHATLAGPKVEWVVLEQAILAGTRGVQAKEEAARLAQADLIGDMERAHLNGATADARTTWPDGFDWRAHGVRIDNVEEASAGE